MNRTQRQRAREHAATTSPLACLVASNAPWSSTGYGTQTKQLTRRMVSDGIATAIAANYGLEATHIVWEGMPIFPRGFDAYSSDVVGAYAKEWAEANHDRKTFVLSLFDVWVFLGHPGWESIPLDIVSWVPIDHSPVPPKVARWCAKDNVTPVAMSHFGSQQLARLGIDHVCIPHGIETGVYKPTESADDGSGRIVTGRELTGVPDDAHVTGIVNANKGSHPVRKAFDVQILAWSEFARNKPDAHLYIHSEAHGAMGGIPLEPLLASCGAPKDRVHIVNQFLIRSGLPDPAMAAIYSSLDVLLSPTMGEGFGLTVAEMAACEGRAIVSDFSAQPELVVDGWHVGGQPSWDPNQQAWFFTPSVMEVVKALEESYEDRRRSPQARQHIIDNYDADGLYSSGWRKLWKRLTP